MRQFPGTAIPVNVNAYWSNPASRPVYNVYICGWSSILQAKKTKWHLHMDHITCSLFLSPCRKGKETPDLLCLFNSFGT